MRLNVKLYAYFMSCLLRVCISRSVSTDCLVGKFLSKGPLREDRGLVGVSQPPVRGPYRALASIIPGSEWFS